jgi:hypothetical protein
MQKPRLFCVRYDQLKTDFVLGLLPRVVPSSLSTEDNIFTQQVVALPFYKFFQRRLRKPQQCLFR